MACFLVPAAEAVATTVIEKRLKNKENKEVSRLDAAAKDTDISAVSIPLSKRLHTLNTLLWGGSALLLLEHIWHGEIVPYFPFLTAAGNPEEMAEVFHEMATVGISMALLCTGMWAISCAAVSAFKKRTASKKALPDAKGEEPA